MKQYIITQQNLEAIEAAVHVLREHIQAAGAQSDQSINETRNALAGLLSIYPKVESTWSPSGPGSAA